MKKTFTLIALLISGFIFAQLQSPADFLGYDIGTQFSRHATVVNYFEHVAENSNMVAYQAYGKTNERRTLTYAVVSTPKNLANLERIRLDNLSNAGIIAGNANPQTAIVWLSYNVHGNEASSSEAAMSTIYDLITTKKNWLENTVVIIDPCVNPDGRDRYVNWYNQVKSTPYDKLQSAAEHNEPWPGGRPNHYLFDLNRDWAWATQVESAQRLKIYNKWLPHVHVDFHEQGINEPYYFAPAAEPFHEVISDFQRDFQVEIGKNHARYFDDEGWLFFTRERFDLLYPSYGDTYPTFMGAIGMTYEQAGHGRAGLGINNDEGFELTLVDRAAHHTTTGLSTVEISHKNAARLNSEFKKFFNNDNLKYKSYVLKGSPDKINSLIQLLEKHEIKYGFSSRGSVNGLNYTDSGSMNTQGALVVSTNQPKGKMVKVLFEKDAKLSDPLTYDITAWSVPYAYGLDCVASTSHVIASGNAPVISGSKNAITARAAGYILPWNSMADASFLSDLLQNELRVRFSEKELRFNGKSFPRGSLIVTKSDNRKRKDWDATLVKIANEHKRELYASATSFSDNRTDFGSPDIKMVPKNRIALLKGKGVSSLSYGATWHYFETQLKYPVTSIDTEYFSSKTLKNFDVLVLPSGGYSKAIGKNGMDDLKKWIRSGGKVIALGRAVGTFTGIEGFDLKKNKTSNDSEDEKKDEGNLTPYDQRERESVKDFITGSIYKLRMDNSHPMAFGYQNEYYSLKLGAASYKFMNDGYNVGYIENDAVSVSGFSGTAAKEKLKNSMIFGEMPMGKGSIVYMVDDVLFRGFWENGKLLMANSIFFVNSNVARL